MTCGNGTSTQIVYCSSNKTEGDRIRVRVDDSLCDPAKRPIEVLKSCYLPACEENDASLPSILVLEMESRQFTANGSDSNQTSSIYESSLLLTPGMAITNLHRS